MQDAHDFQFDRQDQPQPTAIVYCVSWADWSYWTESGGAWKGRKRPQVRREVFHSRDAAETRRAELRQRGQPDLVVTITPLFVLPAPVVRPAVKPRHGKRGRD